jgi:heme exporter protein D
MFDFDAGHYAAFVWPAYAVTGLVFAVLIIDSLLRARRWRRAAEAPKSEDVA